MTTAIQNFIIETSLVNPIEKIIVQLENKEFRDCDIKWLDNKLYKFTNFAAETLNIKFPEVFQSNIATFNSFTTEYYLKNFNTLLNYFKSI